MNIYVANLSWNTNSDSLQELFSQYGEVTSAYIINDRETGRSRGFGFVEMPNDEEGQKAIDALNETEFEGKNIAISVARPRTERPAVVTVVVAMAAVATVVVAMAAAIVAVATAAAIVAVAMAAEIAVEDINLTT